MKKLSTTAKSESDNLKAQLALEHQQTKKTAHKYYTRQDKLRDKKLGDQIDAHAFIIRDAVLDIATTLEDFATRKTRGVGGKYNALLRNVSARIDKKSNIYYDYPATAFIGLQAIFQGLATKHNNTWNHLAHTIAARLEADHKIRLFKAHHPAYFHTIMQSFDTQMVQQYQHKHRVLMMKFNEFNIEWTPWSAHERLQVANKVLIAILHTIPDILFRNSYRKAGKTVTYIDTTPEADTWFAEFERESGFMHPLFPPTLAQPLDWERNTANKMQGGYHSLELSSKLPFVKTRTTAHEAYVNTFDMEEHRTAVNKLQATQWQINKPVLAVQQQMFKMQLGNGLPAYNPKKLPEFPKHIAPIPNNLWSEQQQSEVALWKAISKKIHTQNRIQKGRVLAYKSTADLAQEYNKYEAFYFVYNTDFRGRIYCATTGLSPQGEDLAKGLLIFHKPHKITRTGLFWLAVHGANTYGHDKVTLDDRVDWIYTQKLQLQEVIKDPISTRHYWGSADKPWQFLAFIYEWARTDFGHNANTLSSLPIALDGSCNGIQHYSAILRDKTAGQAVNLMDSELPSDIYQDVANTLESKLDNLKTTSREAQIWKAANIDRKLTKRPVMTLPYGSTRQSCKEYIYEWMLDHRQSFPKDDKQLFSLALWLTPLLWESIGEVVVSARIGMDWLQKTSSAIMRKEHKPLTWTSPAGFPVYQAYAKMKRTRITTMIAGSIIARVRTTTHEKTCEIDPRKQRTGMAPNFIHSIDSSHLVKTVNATDFDSYAMIHDDFGTHAAFTEDLWEQLRRSFVDMYTTYAPLQDWLKQQIEVNETPPHVGDLDIQDVLKSTYFFA